jgi:hypothetical protein
MEPESIRPGLILRVINSHGLGAPLRALATVETVGTSPAGDWLCTVRYHDKTQTKRGRMFRSHLWAVDLGCFEVASTGSEIVKDEAEAKASAKRTATVLPTRLQLALPLEESESNYITGKN